MPPNPFARDPAVTVGVGADTDEFNNQIDGAVDSLGKMRTAVGLTGAALGALATGALAKSASAAADFEEAMVEVEKVTSPETAEAMGSSIREMATEIPLAQNELAGLAADAGRFGIEGPDAIESFTTSVAKMAEATNLGTEEAGESLARLSELTNTPVSEIENLGSSINSLSNNFATSSQEIVDSMMRSSASLSQLGLTQREIAGLSTSLNEVSESSERAGTRLRRLGQELLSPKKVADLASALGMTEEEFVQMRAESPVALMRQMASTMKEGGDEADALRESLSTTSRQALAGLGQNLEGVAEAQETANTSFEEGESLQEEFEAATDTFNAKLDLFKNQLRNVGIQIGQQLLPPLTDLLEQASSAVDWFEEWNESTDGLAGALGLAGTAVGGLAVAAGAFVGGPAALLVGAIGGIATAAGLLGVEFEGLQETAGGAFGALQEIGTNTLENANELWAEHREAVTAAAEETYAEAQDVIGDAAETVEDVVDEGLGIATNVWEQHEDDVLDAAESGYEAASDAVEDASQAIERTVGGALSAAEGIWNDHASEVEAAASDAFGVVTDEASKVLTQDGEPVVSGPLGLTVSAFRRNWADIEKTVSMSISEFETTLGTVGPTLDKQLLTPLRESDSEIRQTFRGMVSETRETFRTVRDILDQVFDAYLNEFVRPTVQNVNRLWREHLTGEDGIVTNARTAFNSLWNTIIKPTLDLIQAGWDLFGDDILKITRGLFGTLETIFSIGMDSILTSVNITLDLISGDWEGAWDNATGFVERSIGELAAWMEDDAADILGGAAGLIADAVSATFNAAIPDELHIPEFTIGGQSINLPSAEIAGEEIGGGSLSVPSMTVGGDVWDLPQLAEGGLIEQSGLAFVDAGELFSGVPGAEVDRSPGMMLSKAELRDAVAEGVARAADESDLFGAQEIVRALEAHASGGETTIEFRDADRYRAVRR
jgi:TP901 family phage tail tape measure protein